MLDLLAGDTSLEFSWPWMILILPLPWIVTFRQKLSAPSYIAPHLPLFETAKALGFNEVQATPPSNKLNRILLFAAWLCLVIAATRPSYIGEQVDIPLSGRDLMLAIDISPSMEEQDLELNGRAATRLHVVKDVVSKFVTQRSGDRIGLILFGSQPYVQSPLSFDTVTANTLLQEAYLGMAGQATAIGDAIALGVKRLKERPEQSRVLILLSDGANTAGEIPPEKAAQLAAQENIKIYTVGIGADEMVKKSFFGSRRVNPSADLDEEMLTLLANLSDGQYFRARSTQELSEIYQVINALEPVEQETKTFRPTKALFYWLLCASLVFYCLVLLQNLLSKSADLLKNMMRKTK
mgnify:CR=1 FL=1